MKFADKFLRPFHSDDIVGIQRAIQSGVLSGKSDEVSALEHELRCAFRSEGACIAVSSGTAAIHAALSVSGVGEGHAVLVPACSTLPTVLPVLQLGAKPVFYDTTSATDLSPSINDLESKISSNTKAVIALPLWGYPFDMSEMNAFANTYGIPLIEDACQAHFSHVEGQFAGTFGDFGCFSLHDKKIISAGEGGFVFARSDSNVEKMRQYITIGGMSGDAVGLNYKLSGVQAALARSRLTRTEMELATRRINATVYKNAFSGSLIQELSLRAGAQPNYYNFVAMIPASISEPHVDQIHHQLARFGFETDLLKYGGLPGRLPVLNRFYTTAPNAESLIRRSIPLPCHPGMTASRVSELADLIMSTVARPT